MEAMCNRSGLCVEIETELDGNSIDNAKDMLSFD